VPGYPVAAARTFGRFVAPLLDQLVGAVAVPPPTIAVELAAAVASRSDVESLIPLRLEPRASASLGAGAIVSVELSVPGTAGAGAALRAPAAAR